MRKKKSPSEMENRRISKKQLKSSTADNGIGDMKDSSEEIEQMNKEDHRVKKGIKSMCWKVKGDNRHIIGIS